MAIVAVCLGYLLLNYDKQVLNGSEILKITDHSVKQVNNYVDLLHHKRLNVDFVKIHSFKKL